MTDHLITNPFLVPKARIRRIESKAVECIDQCREKLGLDQIPLPIPIEDWIEGPLGIRFGIEDLSHLGEGVLGAADVCDREILISQDLSHEGRFWFTCGHELGHIILHGKVRQVFHDKQVDAWQKTRRYEHQADRFAAAFLMPIPLLARELIRICNDRRLDTRVCLTELLRGADEAAWLWKKVFLPQVTKRFGVSLSAAIHRFADLCLTDGKPLLFEKHIETMFRPLDPQDPIASIQIVDGAPKRIEEEATLFTEMTPD